MHLKIHTVSTLSQTPTLHYMYSQVEEFADDNFKFDENGREFSKRVEKTLWEKEKLLMTSNFSSSRNVLERHVCQTHKIKGLFGKGLTHFHTMTPFDAPGKQGF